jgi:hypothetical protein
VGGELTLAGMTIRRGAFSDCILNSGTTVLQDSIVRDCLGDVFEAAVVNLGTLHVRRSTITENQGMLAGGGILNFGSAIIENSTISHNVSSDGAGILNDGPSLGLNPGFLIIRNSSIIFNRTTTAAGSTGAGISSEGFLEIVNSTIAKNESRFGGAGIAASGDVLITNSTIRENTALTFLSFQGIGAGILITSNGNVKLQNTIVADNTFRAIGTGTTRGPDCFGTIQSLGNNLIGDTTGCDIDLQPTDLTGDPGLDSLVEEALASQTFYPVLANSPLIDQGNPDACPEIDQLGNPRVGTCEIGAVEFQGRMLVEVDVRPRSDANRINPNSSQNINVAIFSANGFDATTLEPNTIRFGATGTEAAPVHLGRRDIDGDGNRDLLVRFQIQELGIQCGDTSATLSGQTSNGLAIVGSSPIRTTGCKERKENLGLRGH